VTYLLKQPVKHGLDVHPALWTGSCFLDLIGARLIPGFSTAPLRAALLASLQVESVSTEREPACRWLRIWLG
jgi:hypothetical protein